jgi:glucose-1-phosphate thymidylyltransferase
VFYGQDFVKRLKRAKNNKDGATLFAYHVNNPEDFGVIIFDKKNQPKKIVEKPRKPKSNYAITGLYFYDNNVIKYAEMIKPSKRGELEITDINNIYMSKKTINIEKLGRGYAWLDTGTYKSMLEASLFVETIEKRQGFKIACLEEIALNNKWINKKQLKNQIKSLKNSEYGLYLSKLLVTENY